MNDVVIRPLRFSADVPAMRAFLETLGLRSRIESERGGWVDMVAGNGMVALHDAASSSTGAKAGDTTLSFEADDIDELKERLFAAGYPDVTIWDEAYGRVLSVTAADETVIWIDERNDDLYGYTLHDAHADTRWSVTPHLTGADQASWQRFLEILGGDYLVDYGPREAEFAVRLDLRTTESLAEVRARLTATGYEPQPDEAGLTLTDPDGQTVKVQA
ncbi:MAG TPA: VOC family protein [Kribbella sp.]|uniref:VOC family protein n=1 Tax=Kribbella sp. TaxID=1871183 RepID=UPI002D76B236|nr:VOC family protein [Kribbella sp.]HET6296954.1 VOC family protein [Kribbella sp.]